MSLTRYKQKRDFKKTPEPKGITGKKSGHRYLIQKHDATRLHYDFRLELDGVLKSWAVTRGPSLDPADKRLAVEVEDHPVAYGSFEGTIPKGQYGGGTVMLWDEGEWEPVGDPRKGLKDGKLVFKLYGKRLTGEWTLVRMRQRDKDKGRNNWLLIKHHDDVAVDSNGDRLLKKNITSVVSGRSMEKIAGSTDSVWGSKKAESKAKPAKKKAAKAPVKKGKPLPAFIPPQLATLSDAMPKGKDWVHEVKFDGYRALAYVQDGKARMFTRNNNDWTGAFQPIADLLEKLPHNCIFDGEIVVPGHNGASSFKMLQEALSEGHLNELQYYVFDILHLNGKDMRKLPLTERKAELEKLLARKAFEGRIIYSEHFTNKDDSFLQQLCSLQYEGVISKLASSTYSSGRGRSWLKTKCHMRQEFIIGGYTLPTHEKRGIGALLLGYYEEEQLVYAGKVGTGFNEELSTLIRQKLDKIPQDKPAFIDVSTAGKRGARWVKPQLVCEVEFTEWTTDGHLRHPSFQGLREDKPAKNIGREKPMHLTTTKAKTIAAAPAQANKTTKLAKGEVLVGGIRISHPERLLYPETDITKQDLAQYYLAVAKHILPQVANRPLSMVRCPEGSGGPCFFQRHIAKGQSPHLYDTGIPVKGRNEDYMMIKDVEGLITLVQWGVIELHPWGCMADKPTLPDRIIFDLDPDPEVKWPAMVEAALDVRARMEERGLESFLKTTGGKGLHVVVPIQRQYGWPTIKVFARAIAESMATDEPARYIAKASKAARKGKIFVDYLRNDLTSTSVAAFSARAREGATVSTPLHWEELKSVKPAELTIKTVPARLAKQKKDPWAELPKLKQKLAAKYLRALDIEIEK